VEREAIARAERRRQALEALEFERSRAEALRERIDALSLELDGRAVDEAAYARLTPEDAAIVREALGDPGPPEPESEEDGAAHLELLEGEIARVQAELTASDARQRAFERFLDALGG